jgi:CDP-2,3-bis-(O-geranylgeranyl)-sn-glycerol synthase
VIVDELHAFALLIAANAVPVIVGKLARERAAQPLDFGSVMPDGERLFGSHKTWRGLLSGIAACALLAAYLGLPAWLGAGFAALSLLADACSSAAKRRMRLKPGSEVLGLDQLAEALVPLLVFARPLELQLSEIVGVTACFVLLDRATAGLRHRRWL